MSSSFSRLLKNGASGRDPALHGVWKCSHIDEYAALSKALCALADSLMLVFQQPVRWCDDQLQWEYTGGKLGVY
jgi:hypothetical protein